MTLRNRIVYSPQYVKGFADALREARNDLQDMHFKHLCQLAKLRNELEEVKQAYAELREIVHDACHNAEQGLTKLYRERAIAVAKAVERDGSTSLQ
jgi:hypothetical protein